ncbi:filament-like plant protein [Malus sylvestris]|uniref:filament-like plant protein n=1 Tax=Malus sylvestris TaxID=3752 RepID=UPI0021ACA114|nr:filament-like plant protein [Malus sylvestris]XP_050127945.1 filament-like plant protein [Malus sylvestris]XP_050127946.1 filament-like plant protein [Malus sylvestris]XP_050127947.1 filament-like plant protein [Malus sylvestris]XP_050127949.1 filament-like plant protein [Malus sylvestris]XP_050127950.1 filament-like plant protein [Malus sylvestris]XP_050127951.1 filament-like plant protein [Malus sylvestris]XP_050127952.1 filament-like plant protein [Malus sylvestris]
MERKWLWKKKSSEKSSGETDSSGSVSSHSERYSDEQEALKASPNHDAQSPEVTSKAASSADDVNDSLKSLAERLSAALVNVSAKEDLVKQHAKVAEEAVAGWEKAENEAAVFKSELEATIQQNSALEDRVSHLDGALKECVRQLRQAREEQEQTVQEAVLKKTCDWESTKLKLESQIVELQRNAEANRSEASAFVDPRLSHRLQSLKKENSALKHQLLSQAEELEIMTIERDLSAQAAETASKQHLESIKKVAKLEAECRRLKALGSKTPVVNDHKSSAASSIYVESCMDSQSDSGERLNMMEIDSQKMNGSEANKRDLTFSDSWASALVAELDQLNNEKAVNRNLPAPSIDIDLMDDFLEMERLASLPQTENGTSCLESEAIVNQTNNEERALRAELEAMSHRTAKLEDKLEKLQVEKERLEVENAELEAMSHRAAELEDMLERMEVERENLVVEKAELKIALSKSQECYVAAEFQLKEAEMKLEELQKELSIAKESRQSIESQLVSMEAEARTMSAKVDSLEAEVQRERALSAEIAVKCQDLEEELSRKKEVKFQKTACSNGELKRKQEDLAVAAGKLADCQKTIASLGNQLKSLATLEDFLIDAGSLPGFTAVAPQVPKADEIWKLHSNVTDSPKRDSVSKPADESSGPSVNRSRNEDNSPPSSSSSTSSTVLSTHVSSEKNRNGFAKFFSRTKGGIRLEI